MNCTDAIEGTAKSILKRLHDQAVSDRIDDSEYIRSVKVVIDATEHFAKGNPELYCEPGRLRQILYAYSKGLWLKDQQTKPRDGAVAGGPAAPDINDGYHDYYFDYLYVHGLYPR
jgi:hypothetical protein